jgi:transglutaminase-like putative cysteine protease
VSLQPHIIRLRPRCDGTVRLVRFETEIEPAPITLSTCLDIEGNSVLHAWFRDTTTQLTIQTSFEVETARGNPFDYLIAAAAETLPIAYGDELSGSPAICGGSTMRIPSRPLHAPSRRPPAGARSIS